MVELPIVTVLKRDKDYILTVVEEHSLWSKSFYYEDTAVNTFSWLIERMKEMSTKVELYRLLDGWCSNGNYK